MLPSYFLIFLFIFSKCDGQGSKKSSSQSASALRAKEKEILDSILSPDIYDRRIRPAAANDTGKNIVYVNLYIRSIDSVSDLKMEYSVQVTLRQQWNDNRLAYAGIGGQVKQLTLEDTSAIWMPDLFIRNEKEGHFHNIISPNQFVRVAPNGDILYSTRISLTLSCPMNLALYPHDIQECPFTMASYAYNDDDLVFLWKSTDPVQISGNLMLPKFTLQRFKTDYCSSITQTGTYSCIRLDFLFEREFSNYLLQIYIPTCMLVIASWISFYLDTYASAARVALGVTTLLTTAMQVAILSQSLPTVSYTMAIDVWTGTCLTFVFCALLEFALVNYVSSLDRSQHKNKGKKSQQDIEEQEQLDDNGSSAIPLRSIATDETGEANVSSGKGPSSKVHINKFTNWFNKFSKSQKIDVVSRILFPVAFVIFNLCYWCTYL